MSNAKIGDELQAFLVALAHERTVVLGELDSLVSLALTAVAKDAAGPGSGRELPARLVDQAYEVLGTTEPVEALATTLGWSDEDDERSL